ncbi:MAG: hypothetical protein AAFQ58_12835 [Pseudomonadota bacterium]
MNTGTSKWALLGILLFGLSACEDLAALDLAGATTGQNLALQSAQLGNGSIKLVPPPGFCIDKRSLKDSFAIMARCDTLGGRPSADAPLAVITATTVAVSGSVSIDSTALETADETILQQATQGQLALIQVKGAPPSPEMRDTYWRGAAPVGNHLVGLAIYEAAAGQELGRDAPDLLVQTIERAEYRPVIVAAAPQDNSATGTPKQTN